MKNQRVFIGTLLIGIGFFFFVDQFQLPYINEMLQWPMILVITGIAFLIHGIIGKEVQSFFPGTLLLGLGLHFTGLHFLPTWPRSWGMYTLIVGFALLIQYFKAKKGSLFTPIILIMLSIAELFYARFQDWLSILVTNLTGLWPLVFVIIGMYLLISNRK